MIGTKIKFIREEKKLTQESVAKKLGISQTAYSKIESNQTQITVDRLKEIAAILEVSEIELINGAPINQFNVEHIDKNFAYIHSFMESHKELYEATISHLKEEIVALRLEKQQLLDTSHIN